MEVPFLQISKVMLVLCVCRVFFCVVGRPGADCGSDHELLIVKFRLKLMKVGKTTRPFRYDLNQMLYYYTVEMTNRLKGLDLIECLMNNRCSFVILTGDRNQDHPHEKEMQKSKLAV